jgi:hypothetical protein
MRVALILDSLGPTPLPSEAAARPPRVPARTKPSKLPARSRARPVLEERDERDDERAQAVALVASTTATPARLPAVIKMDHAISQGEGKLGSEAEQLLFDLLSESGARLVAGAR